MLGLMQKDLCLVLQRSRAVLVIMGIGILMGFSTDGNFMIGYLTMICAILTIGTISYDEFDNGYPFLMTLPVTRKSYVRAKYFFCLLSELVGWMVAMVLFVGCSIAKNEGFDVEKLVEALVFLPVAGLLLAVMLPLQLKYGAEKSRIVLLLICGAIIALSFFGMKLFPRLSGAAERLSTVDDGFIGVLLCALCVVGLLVSCLVSQRIMEKKEL